MCFSSARLATSPAAPAGILVPILRSRPAFRSDGILWFGVRYFGPTEPSSFVLNRHLTCSGKEAPFLAEILSRLSSMEHDPPVPGRVYGQLHLLDLRTRKT